MLWPTKPKAKDRRDRTPTSLRIAAVMKTAAQLRAEAARMREFALGVSDDAGALEAIQAMIEELERHARLLDNGDAGGS